MDKNAIKKFAVWARTELIARVSLKGVEYGITEDNIEDANVDSAHGKVLTADEKKQRQALIAEINDKGYKQVMEEVAYTWFNRFSALRFMEVNGYLPSHVRVFTDEENNFKPQIITEAIHLDLDGLDMEKVYELKDAEKTEKMYKYLLIVQCNALNKILPGMFQKIADYTELLLPDNLLREGSVIQQMIELIPEDDWKDAVQIIGWLYQYYNSEKKDDVFAALKKNVKITKENIPAATQLFTSDWIVRYMVENSLGRLWLEGHPDVKEQLLPTEEEQSAYAAGNRDPEDTKWHYYLEEAEQEPEVQAQLAEIRKEYAALTPDQLKVIDPCSGSGHMMITQHSWMFLSSFEKLRELVFLSDVINMVHLGAHGFEEIGGEVVQTTAFCLRKSGLKKYKATYCRLTQGDSQDKKEKLFLETVNRYYLNKEVLQEIPGCPFAYWLSENEFAAFSFDKLFDVGVTRRGLQTGNKDRFIRYWFEPKSNELQFPKGKAESYKWVIMNNGGNARKWYGEITNAVLWENDGEIIKSTGKAIIPSEELYFKECITWNRISVGNLSVKYQEPGIIQGDMSPFFISHDSDMLKYIMALMNSVVSTAMIHAINPTITMPVGDIAKLPVKVKAEWKEKVDKIVQSNIEISKDDWDSFEISWDFQRHPLLKYSVFTPQMVAKEEANGYLTMNGIADAYRHWEQVCNERFNQLKANEEELNHIFIDIYGLQDELTPEVEDKDVTVRKADLGRDIRSFISYAVGCMFGRYSLDVDGLAYAGGEWDKVNSSEGGRERTLGCASKYASFPADKDNIIPICDDEYFEDDIVGRFVKFVKTVYGADTLDENLKFIADALGGKGQPKDVIRNYFLSDFYSDHCKIYQKRPIYWLFDSGKKNGFKALIYMHRYQPDTIARIRTDYVHEQQARYRTAIADLEQRIVNVSTGERVKLNKKLTTLQAQDTEIRTYEEKIHHLADQMISIDLDDGVKKNYAIFQDVLAKIK